MKLFKKSLQAGVNAAWYLSHPIKALKMAKMDLTNPEGWSWLSGGPTYTGKSISDKTLLEITCTWSAIRLISEAIGSMPLHVYKRTKSGNERADDHYLERKLQLQPNQYMTAMEWKEAMAVSLCCWGQSYNKTDWVGSRVGSIIPVAKPLVTPRIDQTTREIIYSYTENGKTFDLDRRDILPIKGFGGPGLLEGYPVYKMHRQSVALTAAAEEYGARFFGNGGRPSGFFMFDKTLDNEQRELLREELGKKYAGLENSSRIGVLEVGMKYQEVGSKNNDAQFLETRKHQIAETARIWNIPFGLLMEDSGLTYNNNEQQNIRLLTYTLRPYLIRIEQALNSILFTRDEYRKYFIEFDTRGLLRGDSKARSEYYRNMRMIGGMSINEIRRLENLSEREGGDDLHVPLNMAPADLLRELIGADDNQNSGDKDA